MTKRQRTSIPDETPLNQQPSLQALPSELIETILDFIPNMDEKAKNKGEHVRLKLSPLVSFGVTCQVFYKAFQRHPRSFYFQLRSQLPKVIEYHEQSLGYVKSLKKLIKKHEEQLILQIELEKKREEWEMWVNQDTNDQDQRRRFVLCDIDLKRLTKPMRQIIWNNLFQKVRYSRIKVSRADYHYNYEATVHVSDNLEMTHWAYDDEGCSPQWNICVSEAQEDEDFLRVVVYQKDVVSYSTFALKFIRSRLELDECELTDEELVKLLVLSLPWNWGRNCVIMTDKMKAHEHLHFL